MDQITDSDNTLALLSKNIFKPTQPIIQFIATI